MIKLGQVVKCKITGFTGTVVDISFYAYQGSQATIQPICGADGKLADAAMIDATCLEVIKESETEYPFPERKYDYGQAVRDEYTDYEGKIVGYAFYVNGCTRVLVQPKHDEKRDKFDRGMWFQEAQLHPVGKVEKPREHKKTTGGPADKKVFSTPSTRE